MTRFLFWFCVVAFSVFPVAARPSLEVVRNPPEVEQKLSIVSVPVTQCKSGAVGCTIPVPYSYGISADCAGQRLTLQFDVRGYRIEIVDKLKKETPNFDLTLKHELTHVALWKNIMERYFNAAASAALVRFEKQLNDRRKNCAQIQRELFDLLSDYMRRMSQEAERQHALMDGDENYAYQNNQLHLPQKKVDKTRVNPKPIVSVNVLTTKRAVAVSPADDQFVSGGVVKNLKTRAAFEMDRASVKLDCPSGRVNVTLGYASTVAFNEDRGTLLYGYLSNSLNGRVKELERAVSGVSGKIKSDIAVNYKKMVENGLTCGEIRTWLEKRVNAYQSKTNKSLIAKNARLGDAVPLWRDYFKLDMDAKTQARPAFDSDNIFAAAPPSETSEAFDVAQNAPVSSAVVGTVRPDLADPESESRFDPVETAERDAAEPELLPPKKGALFDWLNALKSSKWFENLLEKFKSFVVDPIVGGFKKNQADESD